MRSVYPVLAFVLLIGSLRPLGFQQSPPAAPLEGLRTRVEQIHDAPQTRVRGVRLRLPDSVAHFFQARGFEAAWPIPAAANQIRQAIAGIGRDGLSPAHYHLATIDALLEAHRAAPSADVAIDLQILLTDGVAALVDHVRYGKVRPVSLDRRWNVDPRVGAPPIETTLAEIASSSSPGAAIEAMKPGHFVYTGLKRALEEMRARAASGGWAAIPAGPTLKVGMSNPRVVAVRTRLLATGELPAGAPVDAPLFDPQLEAAVKHFQDHHRLAPDGAVGRATLAAMNVTAAARVQQIRVNLERARWVLGGLTDSFVLVNLPAFKLYVIRNRKNVWEGRTQVGREARQTPAFRADIRYLVFNPYWTVPPTILAQDVLPGMRKGENTIARKRLTILDRQGRRVDPASINWASARASNFPYTLRQTPGADNALGRVKFVFPNEHTVFLHDTPSQELFSADQRTFSSGCIRVERALDLAALLLEGQDDWTPERISEVVHQGHSETVFLNRPLPIVIVYWTVSVGATGELRFARDVYRRDPAVLRALDAN